MVPQNAESPEGGSKELRFRVDDEVHAWLLRYSRRWGVSVSSVARMMLLRGTETRGEDGPTGYSQMFDEGKRVPLSLTRTDDDYNPEVEQVDEVAGFAEHVHEFEFQRKRAGKASNPNRLYVCACGEQEWRFQ